MKPGLNNTHTSLIAVFVVVLGCGAGPKPAELLNFEEMRKDEYGETVKERFPALFKEADGYYLNAIDAHDDGEPEDTRHWTRMATITWRSAVALSQKKDAEDSIKAAQNRLKAGEEDLEKAKARRKTAEALAELKNMKFENRKGKINEALAKLKEAEAMDAGRYAPEDLAKAHASFDAAAHAVDSGNEAAGERAAIQVLAEINALIALVKPHHDVDKKLKTIYEASRDLPNTEPRLADRGLILMVHELFPGNSTKIQKARAVALDRIVKFTEQYPDLYVLIAGHTDNYGNANRNLVLSQGRAGAVQNYLVEKGVSAQRLSVSGHGEEEPVADNSSRQGRAQNRRVDVVFLRQVKQ